MSRAIVYGIAAKDADIVRQGLVSRITIWLVIDPWDDLEVIDKRPLLGRSRAALNNHFLDP